MKIYILILTLSFNLFAFNFNAPPAKEEVMEPSVLGEEVQDPNPKKRVEIYDSKKDEDDEDFDRSWGKTDDSVNSSKTIYVEHKPSFDPDMVDINHPKIALLVPRRVIKKYANSVDDSILSYLLFKKTEFELEIFDSIDENPKHIVDTLNKIRSKGFLFVIAPMTQRGARWIAKYEKSLIIYIPTVNKKEVPLQSDNIFFGGIDYEEQIDKLLTFAGERVAIFNDKSPLSAKIASFVKDAAFSDISYERVIANTRVNLKPILKNNHKLDDASIFLNMPIVKTSLLASQLSLYGVQYKNLLLTQIAYNPLIFTLTQKKDREKMYIANSIGKSNFRLKDINLIFGKNIDFAWVNYSTMLGVDYIFSNFIYSGSKLFREKMVNNQISYKIDILKPTHSSFHKVEVPYK